MLSCLSGKGPLKDCLVVGVALAGGLHFNVGSVQKVMRSFIFDHMRRPSKVKIHQALKKMRAGSINSLQ